VLGSFALGPSTKNIAGRPRCGAGCKVWWLGWLPLVDLLGGWGCAACIWSWQEYFGRRRPRRNARVTGEWCGECGCWGLRSDVAGCLADGRLFELCNLKSKSNCLPTQFNHRHDSHRKASRRADLTSTLVGRTGQLARDVPNPVGVTPPVAKPKASTTSHHFPQPPRCAAAPNSSSADSTLAAAAPTIPTMSFVRATSRVARVARVPAYRAAPVALSATRAFSQSAARRSDAHAEETFEEFTARYVSHWKSWGRRGEARSTARRAGMTCH
jgi:hypothetical protein